MRQPACVYLWQPSTQVNQAPVYCFETFCMLGEGSGNISRVWSIWCIHVLPKQANCSKLQRQCKKTAWGEFFLRKLCTPLCFPEKVTATSNPTPWALDHYILVFCKIHEGRTDVSQQPKIITLTLISGQQAAQFVNPLEVNWKLLCDGKLTTAVEFVLATPVTFWLARS